MPRVQIKWKQHCQVVLKSTKVVRKRKRNANKTSAQQTVKFLKTNSGNRKSRNRFTPTAIRLGLPAMHQHWDAIAKRKKDKKARKYRDSTMP